MQTRKRPVKNRDLADLSSRQLISIHHPICMRQTLLIHSSFEDNSGSRVRPPRWSVPNPSGNDQQPMTAPRPSCPSRPQQRTITNTAKGMEMDLPGDSKGEYRGIVYRNDADLKAWLAKRPGETALEPDLPIIDPHHHFWDTPQ